MSFSITTYFIAGVAVVFVSLFWLMNYYKAKSKRLSVKLEQSNITNEQLQTEIKHVQVKQQIEADNFALDGDQLDERMREKGYYRQQ